MKAGLARLKLGHAPALVEGYAEASVGVEHDGAQRGEPAHGDGGVRSGRSGIVHDPSFHLRCGELEIERVVVLEGDEADVRGAGRFGTDLRKVVAGSPDDKLIVAVFVRRRPADGVDGGIEIEAVGPAENDLVAGSASITPIDPPAYRDGPKLDGSGARLTVGDHERLDRLGRGLVGQGDPQRVATRGNPRQATLPPQIGPGLEEHLFEVGRGELASCVRRRAPLPCDPGFEATARM